MFLYGAICLRYGTKNIIPYFILFKYLYGGAFMDNNNTAASGGIKVADDVIAKIAVLAASEIQGVALDEEGKLLVPQVNILKIKLSRNPVKVSVSKEAAVIDISVITEQGSKAVNVASAVQENVKSAVQSMTGVPVSKVNVNIVGIRLSK